jgi:hypothetical protein
MNQQFGASKSASDIEAENLHIPQVPAGILGQENDKYDFPSLKGAPIDQP